MKRNNRVVIALQGLCLTLVLVIQCTLTQVTIPTIELSEALDVHRLKFNAWTINNSVRILQRIQIIITKI